MSDTLKNGVPIIERMMDVLDALEVQPKGSTVRDLGTTLSIARSTVYRILNTLEHREMVRHDAAGLYVLGPKIVSLAAQVAGTTGINLAEVCAPALLGLSQRLGQACKISITDGSDVTVLARLDGAQAYGVSINPELRLPLHAGAAGKLLLAYLPPTAIDRVLEGPLPSFTPRTLVDPAKIRANLRQILRRDWADDRGEYMALVNAFAAPIRNGSSQVIGAVSTPFLSGTSKTDADLIRVAVIETGIAMSAAVEAASHRR